MLVFQDWIRSYEKIFYASTSQPVQMRLLWDPVKSKLGLHQNTHHHTLELPVTFSFRGLGTP